MELVTRRATAEDAAAICAIYNHHVEHTTVTFDVEPVHAQQMAKRIESTVAEYDWIVAVHATNVVGYAYYGEFRARCAYSQTVECTVYVAEGMQGRGIATRLYTELFRSAEEQGLRELIAVVALPNPASEQFHKKLGFVHSGTLRRVGFKFERFVDVAYWQRSVQR